MNYNEFKKEVKNTFADYLPEGYKDMKVKISTIQKANQTFDGLTLVSSGEVISPVLYVDDMYEAFYESGDFHGVVSAAAKRFLDNIAFAFNSFDLKQLTPDKVKENLVFRLVNTELNREILKDMPHREMMDLSVVYCYINDDLDDALETIWIRNAFADYLGLDEQALYEAAVVNTREVRPPQVFTLNKQCKENSDGSDESVDRYMVTNDRGFYGAVNMLYTDILDGIYRECKKNLYILPSSIHEILILPEYGKENVHFLKALVKEVNQDVLRPQDVLSNNVYFYDGNSLKIAEPVADISE